MKRIKDLRMYALKVRHILQTSLKKDYYNHESHYKLGTVLRYLGENKRSFQCFQRAVVISMRYNKLVRPDMAYEIAVGAYIAGKHKAALSYLSSLKEPLAMQLVCECYIALRQYKGVA
jgi:hypothetical protein